jgi:hypothetical protein
MPSDDGIGFDEDERVRPTRPKGAESDPEETVDWSKVRAGTLAPEHGKLMAEGEDFEAEVVAGTEEGLQIREEK